MRRHALGHIHHDADAQAIQHPEQLAPMHGLPAALDLAQEVLADAYAAGGIVLANPLRLASGAYHRADAGGIVDGNLHAGILTFVWIMDVFCGISNKSARLQGFFLRNHAQLQNPRGREDSCEAQGQW